VNFVKLGKLSSAEKTRRISLIALFGVAVFTSKALTAFLPPPIDKMLVAPQALFLALGALLSRRFGGTMVAAIGAVLTIFMKPSLAIFTLAFALIYGILTDGFVLIFHVKTSNGDVRQKRLVFAVTLSTALSGLASYSTSVLLELVLRNPILEIIVFVGGVINGLLGGYIAVLMWRKALRHMVVSIER